MYIYIYIHIYAIPVTANLRTKILDFRGLDAGRILNSKCGILMCVGSSPKSLSQEILVGRLAIPINTDTNMNITIKVKNEFYVVLCCTVLYLIVLCGTVLYYSLLYYTTLYYTIHYTTLHYTTLHYTTLYSTNTILYYTIL